MKPTRTFWYQLSWIAGALAALELVGLWAGSCLPWWLAVPFIGAAGAVAAYTVEEHL